MKNVSNNLNLPNFGAIRPQHTAAEVQTDCPQKSVNAELADSSACDCLRSIALAKPKVTLRKINVKYKDGYNNGGTSCKTTTIYSYLDRYPEQKSAIKDIFEKSNSPVKMLLIGAAEGQEPLTHSQTAFDIAQKKGKEINDVLDLSIIEAAEPIPINTDIAKLHNIDDETVEFLQSVYDDKTKTHFSSPFENIIPKLKKEGKKQDVILFNNVIQHVNYGKNGENEELIFSALNDLTDMVNKNGLFCFSCEERVLDLNDDINDYYNKVLEMLKNKGFEEIAKGVFKKII